MNHKKRGKMRMTKASTLPELLYKFDDFALDNEESYDAYYVETSYARGNDVSFRISTRFHSIPEGFPKKILFMGHNGSGKTTELYKISNQLQDRYVVVMFSIKKELDIYRFNYVDLVFAILDNILETAKKHNIKIKQSVIDNLYSYWNDEKILEVTKISKIAAEANIEVKRNFLSLISASIKGIFQTGVESKETIRNKMEPSILQLMNYIDAIISDINLQLKGKELLLIIEDLDKLDIQSGDDLFVFHRNILCNLNIPAIYTFPIYLYYTTKFKGISDDFDHELLSMIKIKERDGSPCETGIKTLSEIVYKRADKNLFDDEALEFIIKKSGGAMRDIFNMITTSSLNALERINLNSSNTDQEKIIQISDAKKAFLTLKSGYERSIKQQFINVLNAVYNDPIKKPIENEENVMQECLSSMLLIEYNGERWCALHPAVECYLKEKNLLINE